MYAYSLLHDLLLKNLCQMLANIVNKADSGQYKWQVRPDISDNLKQLYLQAVPVLLLLQVEYRWLGH